jgi:hypothetical protein
VQPIEKVGYDADRMVEESRAVCRIEGSVPIESAGSDVASNRLTTEGIAMAGLARARALWWVHEPYGRVLGGCG